VRSTRRGGLEEIGPIPFVTGRSKGKEGPPTSEGGEEGKGLTWWKRELFCQRRYVSFCTSS